jgi:hypothetical protein
MILHTNDYLEYYLTLVGWLINGGIWDIISNTGLFAAPFAAMVIQEWLKARGEGADEGNKGVLALARVENRFYTAIIVLVLACMPLVQVSFDTLTFDQTRSAQCQYQLPTPSETGWNTSFSTLNGKSSTVPVWWFFVHAMSKSVTAASVASIPCGVDLQQIRMDINSTRINSPLLAQEVADFTSDCYGRARAKLFMTQPSLTEDQLNDVNWIGSHFFLQTSGYYSDGMSGFRSHTPRAAWPYDATRDAGLAQTTGGGGYPTCTQWWSDSTIGLKARLIDQVKPDVFTQIKQWANFLSQDQVNDSVIRDLVSPKKQILTQGQVYSDYGGQISPTLFNTLARATAGIGQGVGSVVYFPAMDSVRQAAPMVMAFLKMALIVCIPFILTLGTYSLEVVMTLTMAQFGMIFVDFWFQLARWVDSTIMDGLYGNGMYGLGNNSAHSNFDPVEGLSNMQGDMLLSYVMATMFLILPGLWFTALGWVNSKISGTISSLTTGANAAKNESGQGAKVVSKGVNAVTGGFKEGVK